MRIRPALSTPMRALVRHPDVVALVHAINTDPLLIEIAAQILRGNFGKDMEALSASLEAERQMNLEFEETEDGLLLGMLPQDVEDLLEAIWTLYDGASNPTNANHRRAAVLESLVKQLIEDIYDPGECETNCLVYARSNSSVEVTHQEVDVAAWHTADSYGEAYECAMKPYGLGGSDCTNILAIYDECDPYATWLRVGLVSFEASVELLVRKCNLQQDRLDGRTYDCLAVFGCDNLTQLQYD